MTGNSRSAQKEISRNRILDVAAKAIRRDGYAGVGVADVMSKAGLTHGGFYAHFESREMMLAAALERAGELGAEVLASRIADRCANGDTAVAALVETYLADANLASPEMGCPVAALASEMPRQADQLRDASCRQVQGLLKMVKAALPSGSAAAVMASTMVGALQLARTLGNNAKGKAHLAAVRKALIDQYDIDLADKTRR
ncbi:MAG TPA: TetR/AcrR family transcriptional regulator [Noviherbaspirillum sp.]|nr:TetR/AcrR family transcriptional regulator [Noviherbaspirillum sp.]